MTKYYGKTGPESVEIDAFVMISRQSIQDPAPSDSQTVGV